MNLIPLKGWSLKYLMGVQGWGNLVLGMPWGFGYPFVMPVSGWRWRSVVQSGAILAASIELTQLAISLVYGFAYRVIDINDFLLNLAGVMLGYALLRALAFVYRTASGRRLLMDAQE